MFQVKDYSAPPSYIKKISSTNHEFFWLEMNDEIFMNAKISKAIYFGNLSQEPFKSFPLQAHTKIHSDRLGKFMYLSEEEEHIQHCQD